MARFDRGLPGRGAMRRCANEYLEHRSVPVW